MTFKKWHQCSKADKIARWRNAVRVLRAMPAHERRKHWDMSVWGVETACGTIACAAGQCGLDPWFRRRGLILRPLKLAATDLRKIADEPDYLVGAGGFEDMDESDFFGSLGGEQIFENSEPRTVGTVIREMTEYLKVLIKDPGADPEWDWSQMRWLPSVSV